MIQADPSGRFVLHVDLGLDKIFVWKFDDQQGRADPERSARGLPAPRRRAAAFPFPPERPLALFDPGGRLDGRPVRLRLRERTAEPPRQTISTLPPGFAGSNFCSEILVSADGRFLYAGNRLHDSIAIFSVGEDGTPDLSSAKNGRAGTTRAASTSTRPAGFSTAAISAADNVTIFRVDRATGGLDVHRPLHPRRQSVDHRLPRSGRKDEVTARHVPEEELLVQRRRDAEKSRG